MITLIAAVAKNGVIGNGNVIPWHLPEDFKHFSQTTRDHAVIMGRATWDSLPEKFRPLPKRTNIVVSRSPSHTMSSSYWTDSIDDAIAMAREIHGQDDIFIIGGASIYEQTIAKADKLILSEVDLEPEGDTFFPEIGPEWVVSNRDSREGFNIVTYLRGGGDE